MTRGTPSSNDKAATLLPPSAAMLIADDEARFREVNEPALTLLKYSEQQLKQMRVWDITEAPQQGDARAMWKEFIREGHQAGVYQVRRADGRRVTVQYEATANVGPGRHLSILRPVSRSLASSRPLDECPFDRPFPADFKGCPTYQPQRAKIADSREQPVADVMTCGHLAATRMSRSSAYYGRCTLGDALDRSRWLSNVAPLSRA